MAVILTKEQTLKSQSDILRKENKILSKLSPILMILGTALIIAGVIVLFVSKDSDNYTLIIVGVFLIFVGFGQRYKKNYNEDDVNKMKYGKKGENFVLNNLKNKLPDNYYILNDCNVKGVGMEKSQIDHLLVSADGIFVIETKNYKGRIEGAALDKDVLQTKTSQDGREEKQYVSNPVSQNEYHCKVFKDFLKINKINISEEFIKSVIIFANKFVEVNIFNVDEKNIYVGKMFGALDFIKENSKQSVISADEINKLLKLLVPNFSGISSN
ncbi:MAG TPA: nuclease-related domain-containing protein [bacterium]|nr:nuclease-related domain-containing protein [bacterium]HPN31467.1 nuclease-related domain-containing protein [bacterium]